MTKDLLPFVISILVGLAQPVADLNWKGRFEELYDAKEASLEGAASWIASIAAFFPSCVLTVYGAVLLVVSSTWADLVVLVPVSFGLLVASVLLYLWEGHRGIPERRPVLGFYNFLQIWLILLNGLGIAGAVILGLTDPS